MMPGIGGMNLEEMLRDVQYQIALKEAKLKAKQDLAGAECAAIEFDIAKLKQAQTKLEGMKASGATSGLIVGPGGMPPAPFGM